MRTRVYTIGHGKQSLDELAKKLRWHRVETLVDVRSNPYSRQSPQFNYGSLDQRLVQYRLEYLYMGNVLGGHPKDPKFTLENGEVDYELLVADQGFIEALGRLAFLSSRSTICLLCAEENPARCHRGTLLAPLLAARNVTVSHILSDGSLEPAQLPLEPEKPDAPEQLDIFGIDE